MDTNAYILDWTMNDFEILKSSLTAKGLTWFRDGEKNHIRVHVGISNIDSFAEIAQKHLNAKFNYVDTQFRDEKLTVVIFKDRVLRIQNPDEDRKAKDWAISIGLPKEQADWATSF